MEKISEIFCSEMSIEQELNENQVLWINILMDGPPAQSLGVEPADPDMVKGKPRSRTLKLLNRGLTIRVCINAFLARDSFILKTVSKKV